MFSKILLPTDETTEDQRVSADRRSLPPPPSESSDHRSGGQGFLGLKASRGGGRRTRPASAKPRTVSEVRAEEGKPRAQGAASSGPPVSGFD